ncbi:hypothetical protein C8J57DRAFT_1499848 [Mycena rebaudengoi]|nr:hypothetical protein C8J57DRAFT_1499848 [Mycena rebaudengoi]
MATRPAGVPSAATIAAEVDRLTIHRPNPKKSLPSTFLSTYSVHERLRDLAAERLPDSDPSIDRACSKTLTDSEICAVNLANDALLLFSRLAYLVDHGDAVLRSLMLQAWSAGVWKWMLFLYNSGIDLNDTVAKQGRPLSRVTRQTVTVGLMDALIGCADSVPLGKRLLLVPDVVALIGKLWVENLQIEGRPADMVHRELTFVMYHIMNDDKTANGSVTTTLIDAVDGGAKTIIHATTQHFQRLLSVPEASLDFKRVKEHIYFVEFLTKTSTLRDAMHEDETLSVAILAVDVLTRTARRIGTTQAHAVVEICVGLLLLPHLLSGANVQPLIKAINKGLLRTLYNARLTFRAHNDCCDALTDVILGVVCPSLAFRSVTHAIERAEHKTGFFASYEIDKDKHRFEEWDTFFEAFHSTIYFRGENDYVTSSRACGRSECLTNASEDTIKLQRCARCQYRMYCSRECQQQDWPKYKHMCRKEDDEMITPISDREFVRDLAEWEVKMNMGSLCKRMQKNPALKDATADLMLQVDFTSHERDIAIGLVPNEHTRRVDKPRTVAIYGKVQSGREVLRTLGLVTEWEELREDAKLKNMFEVTDESALAAALRMMSTK